MKSSGKLLLMLVFVMASTGLAAGNGVLMVVKGDVKVQSVKSKTMTAAKVGMQVNEGDTVIAGKDSRAKLVMMDKNIINISPDSKFTLEKYVNDENKDNKNVVLNVLYGKIRSTVNQKYDGEKSKFHVKTPSAVAGVRGTDFFTGYNVSNKQTTIVTIQGQVEVSSGLAANGSIANSVFVNPGQQTVASAGQPPAPPTAASQAQMQSLVAESNGDSSEAKEKKDDSRGPADENKKEEESDKDKKKDEGKDAKKDDKDSKKEDKDSKKDAKKDDGKDAKKEDGKDAKKDKSES